MSTRCFVPTVICSGFPAIGKSFIAAKFPIMVRDLESSEYHWLMNTNKEFELDKYGDKILNPEWPLNYIEQIKALEKSGMYRSVLVSNHEIVRSEMAKNKIKYSNIFPENTPEMKKIILDRCRVRNSTPEFIASLDKNWDMYIDSLINDKGASANIQLNPQSLKMWSSWILME